jgi:hypothetical protein
VAWHVGPRNAEAAGIFIDDLASRLARRVQITTDGLQHYPPAIARAFGWNGVDYARLVKVFGAISRRGWGRYSPPPVIGAEKIPVIGEPDPHNISTSFVERANLTIRMETRRFTRLTNAFSKKLENHTHAVALNFLHYNFCRPHETPTRAMQGVLTTPAMVVGAADHVWNAEEVVALLSPI